MRSIVFITPLSLPYGFKLAGVKQHAIGEGEIEKKLYSLLNDPDTGLIVIDERLLRDFSPGKLRELEERWFGLILVLPSPEEYTAVAEDYTLSLIKRAIGYHVRLT